MMPVLTRHRHFQSSGMLQFNHNTSLLVYTLIAVLGLIVLIAKYKFNSFVALILASIFVGLCAGMKPTAITKSFLDGVGAILGSIAAVVGLGTILGKLLGESGGAEVVASTLIRALGEKRIHWTMMLVGFIVGIPVFFAVGLVLLVPILFNVRAQTKTPLLYLGIPLVAGLAVAHGFVPPHPGPMAAIGVFQANVGKTDVGKTIFYSILIGLPIAIIAGPIFGKFIAGRVSVAAADGIASQLTHESGRKSRPGFALTILTILLPVLLMLSATIADITFVAGHPAREWIDFAGSPLIAMLLSLLLALYSFGYARGFKKDQILKFSNDCLGPVATILLVVGAGGGFNKVLIASGVGEAVAAFAKFSQLSPLLLGWLVAALIRLATGSATVAITTAAGILAPIAASVPGTNLELLVLAMGAGSAILSHVNDGGFWFVKEYFNMTVVQTLKTWTVMVTIISIVGLLLVLLLDALL
jgi:GntP family gluconate:H+ symporter